MIRTRSIFLLLILLCVLASGCVPTAATPPEPSQTTDERATGTSSPPATSISNPPATSTSSPPATSTSSPTDEPATDTSNLPTTGISSPTQETFAFRVLTTGLSHPWDIAFGPDGYLWITERTGKQVTRVNPADGSKHVAI